MKTSKIKMEEEEEEESLEKGVCDRCALTQGERILEKERIRALTKWVEQAAEVRRTSERRGKRKRSMRSMRFSLPREEDKGEV